MVDKGKLYISILDENAKDRVPGSQSMVTVSVNGKALTYDDSKKRFIYDISDEVLEIDLAVRYKGFAELRQWFKVKTSPNNITLVPFWPGTNQKTCMPEDSVLNKSREGYLLECMDLDRHRGLYSPNKTEFSYRLKVNLLPTREYVAGVGTDYPSSGLEFAASAVTFAQHLFARKLLNSSSPFTMIDCRRGVDERWMRAKKRGWRRQYLLLERTPGKWRSRNSFKKWRKQVEDGNINIGDYLSATDMYYYLNSKGMQRPGTVMEFSVFSHGWEEGPVLYDTYDRETGTNRSDKDFDMRYKKDFINPAAQGWPSMPQAFANGANIHIWGCYGSDQLQSMLRHLHYQRTSTLTDDQGTWTVDQIKDLLKKLTTSKSYCPAIAKFTRRTAYGSPPGLSSDFKKYLKIYRIVRRLTDQVSDAIAKAKLRRQLLKIRGKIMYVSKAQYPASPFRKVYERSDLGSRKFNYFGYMRYDPPGP
jgi:hypothetical protein